MKVFVLMVMALIGIALIPVVPEVVVIFAPIYFIFLMMEVLSNNERTS